MANIISLNVAAIAEGPTTCETFNGVSAYNSHASDQVLLHIQLGSETTATPSSLAPVIPVAIAAGQSVNWYMESENAIPAGGSITISDQSSGTANISDLTGVVFIGARTS